MIRKIFSSPGLVSLMIALFPVLLCLYVYIFLALPFPQIGCPAFNVAFGIGFAFFIFPVFCLCLPLSLIRAMRMLKEFKKMEDLKNLKDNDKKEKFLAIVTIFLDLFFLFWILYIFFL